MDAAAEQVVRTELVHRRDGARLTIRRGVSLVLSVPIVIVGSIFFAAAFGGYVSLAVITLAAIWSLSAGISGATYIAEGASLSRRYTRQLRGLDARHQLPEARLLR